MQPYMWVALAIGAMFVVASIRESHLQDRWDAYRAQYRIDRAYDARVAANAMRRMK
jgi:hypothetical protein